MTTTRWFQKSLTLIAVCKLLRRVLSIHQKRDGFFEILSCLWLPGGFEIPLEGAYAVL